MLFYVPAVLPPEAVEENSRVKGKTFKLIILATLASVFGVCIHKYGSVIFIKMKTIFIGGVSFLGSQGNNNSYSKGHNGAKQSVNVPTRSRGANSL